MSHHSWRAFSHSVTRDNYHLITFPYNKLARKRRNLTTIQVAERANISRNTLYLLEKGNASTSIGTLFNVLRVLGLQDDFLKLAADDELGRKLQDLGLLGNEYK